MADLTGRDRGQIILVAAFALGVIFIALAVVVNAAIFTENLATRGAGTSDDDALQYRHEVERNVGEIIEYLNENADSSDGHSDLANRGKANITNLTRQSSRQKALSGRVANVSYNSKVDGTRFVNTSGTFTDSDGNADWTVAENVDRTRGLEFDVTDVSGSSFKLSLNDSGDFWNMTVVDSGGSNVTVTVTNGNGESASCTRSVSGSFTIDVTGGSVAGEPCQALTVRNDGEEMWFGSGISSSYDIEFREADTIEGEYEGVTDGSVSSDFPNDSSRVTDAIYSLRVDYTYETTSLRYETEIRVAPGEPES